MKGSLVILSFFVLGIVAGRTGILPMWMGEGIWSRLILGLLLFSVAFSLGVNPAVARRIRDIDRRLLFLPLATIGGTLGGSALASVLLPDRSIADCLAVGSGFGYYSLSSVLITEYRGAELGAVALLANVWREMATLVLAPVLVRWFGRFAPMSAGGATTMDTTLPVSVRYAGLEYVPLSVYHGFVMDTSVFFLVSFFCHL